MTPRRTTNREGWNRYAETWHDARRSAALADVSPADHTRVAHLGDEWSLMEETRFPYGIPAGFEGPRGLARYLETRLLQPNLPERLDLTILELGPGGGRVTELLLPRAARLYAVDVSESMLEHLTTRFAGDARITPVVTDGARLSGVPLDSIEAFVSFDACVHMEPHEIFNYLRELQPLLRRGAVGILHAADATTPIGCELFCSQVGPQLRGQREYWMFGTMCAALLRTFLERLGYEIIRIGDDPIPRDVVAVFRKP